MALLSWVYMSSVIMLFGAQFTALVHREHLYAASESKTHGGTGELAAEEKV